MVWGGGNSEILIQACGAVRTQDKQDSGASDDVAISSDTPRKVSPRNNRDQDESINSLPRVSYTHAVCTHSVHKSLVAFVSACILGHIWIPFCSKGKNN